jgi:hypothetical protein
VCVNPAQVCVNPAQVCVNPPQVCVNPTQVCVNPPQVRHLSGLVLFGGNEGGRKTLQPVNDVHTFDPRVDAWQRVATTVMNPYLLKIPVELSVSL